MLSFNQKNQNSDKKINRKVRKGVRKGHKKIIVLTNFTACQTVQ